MSNLDEYLKHFGVLGMHWGVRKDRIPTTQPKRTRKELRTINKAGQLAWDQKHANDILAAAKKDALIKVTVWGDMYPYIVTGKEFTDFLSAGGILNVRMSDVYANKTTSGNFEMIPPAQRYQKIKR